MSDFSVLKLVRCTREDKNADNEIWEITEYGKELHSAYRLRQLDKVLARKSENPEGAEN
jgi:hypothetical protein